MESKLESELSNLGVFNTTKKERLSYSAYLFGQNIFYVICSALLVTYATDIGINPLKLAPVLLAVKIWDAFNDSIFGILVDKLHLKGGKFMPWLKISLIGIPISTILLFLVPRSLPEWGKITWIAVAYILWDTSYTICDIPIYGLPTAMTSNQVERTTIMSQGRLCSNVSYAFAIAAIPLINGLLRDVLQISLTWEITIIVFSILSMLAMIPVCIYCKERITPEAEKPIKFKEMLNYMAKNKYLLLFYLAFIITGLFGVAGTLGIQIGRYLTPLMDVYSTVAGVVSLIPFVVIAALIPKLTRKYDKFNLFIIGTVFTILFTILSYFIGYKNQTVFWIMYALRTLPACITNILIFMFTADCAEYGFYKTGNNASGCAFATQTFSAKINATLGSSICLIVLSVIGFVAGEPQNGVAVQQAAGFEDKLWFASLIIPIIGLTLSLIPLFFYKLRDYKVEIMALYNKKEITKDESERLLSMTKKEYDLFKEGKKNANSQAV